MDKPLVSVIIPTYNGAKTLKRAVDSVLGQTYEKIEIIVVDDNDPESEARAETAEIMEALHDHRIRYIRHDRNKNGSAARNTGVALASGDCVSFLDDDDILLPWRIRDAAEKIRQGFDIVFVKVLLQKYGRIYASAEIEAKGDFFHALLQNPLLVGTGSNLFLKKELYDRAGGFDETLTRHQDYEFLIRALSGEVRIGTISNYAIIKVMDRTQNMVQYEKLKEIKNKIYLKHKSKLTQLLTESEKRNIMITHHVELLYTAAAENNREGVREQKNILRTFDYIPGPKDDLRAWVKYFDRAELIQKTFAIIQQRKLTEKIRQTDPRCSTWLKEAGYIN